MNHAGEQGMGYCGGSTPSRAVTYCEYVWLVRIKNWVRRIKHPDIAHITLPE